MKRALIITYYWPPSGGAGVQRWLKFAKYMRGVGFEPVIYTPSNPETPVEDLSLFSDVPSGIELWQQPIWEPYHLYKKWVGVKPTEKINTGFLSESKKPKITEKIGVWIRGNFFIPDARCFWIQPSIRYLTERLKKEQVDVIISTGPPHSMHLIAHGVKKNTGLPWLADFRDPWTNIDFYPELMLTPWADAKHRRLEKEVIRSADHIVTVTQKDKADYLEMGAKKATTITNGYDDEFHDHVDLDLGFTLVHVGSIPPARNHKVLWEVLSEIKTSHFSLLNDFKLKLIGKTDVSVSQCIEEFQLQDLVELVPYLSHDQAILAQQRAHVLLLLVNQSQNAKAILTGKFFEYLATGRPILVIGPTDGEVATILHESGNGVCIDFHDHKGLKDNLLQFIQQRHPDSHQSNRAPITYSRKELTKQLCSILDTLIHENQSHSKQ